MIECVFFSEPWSRSQRALQNGKAVLVTGRVEGGEDEPKILATSAELLSEVRARSTTEVRFHLAIEELDGDRLDRFVALLRKQRGPCRARLVVQRRGRFEAELDLPQHPVDPGTALEEDVQGLFGRGDVVALA
jgi:DNA polymerase III alpha subunit